MTDGGQDFAELFYSWDSGRFFLHKGAPMPRESYVLHVRLRNAKRLALEYEARRLQIPVSDLVRRCIEVALPAFQDVSMPGGTSEASHEDDVRQV
jgi:hypothetical protein